MPGFPSAAEAAKYGRVILILCEVSFMFREMRRKKQALTPEECAQLLKTATSGVLALHGEDGYPYAVPISYVYDGASLYFHCAQEGHKLDAIRRDSKASFCVIAKDRVVPEEYTTYYQSVIVFGRMRILTDEAQKRAAAEKLALRYAPSDSAAHRGAVIDREWTALCMLEMQIEHITGKEAIELTKAKLR